MKFNALLVISLTVATLGCSLPSWAIDGRTAVGQCIDMTATGARCGWSVSQDGSIDICTKSGCITCPSATDECTLANKAPRRPNFNLPIRNTPGLVRE
jgi:hypothetical protein